VLVQRVAYASFAPPSAVPRGDVHMGRSAPALTLLGGTGEIVSGRGHGDDQKCVPTHVAPVESPARAQCPRDQSSAWQGLCARTSSTLREVQSAPPRFTDCGIHP